MKKIVIPIILSLLIFTGCTNKDVSQDENNKNKINNENISVEVNESTFMKVTYAFTPNNDLLLNVWNLNNEILKYASIDIAMLDENDKLLSVQKEYVKNLDKDHENVFRIFLSNNKKVKKIQISANKVDVKTSVENYVTDKVSGTIKKGANGKLVATIKNNSGEVIDGVNASIVIYKNDELKDGITFTVNNLIDIATQEFYLHATIENGVTTYMDYDKAEVIINYAYKIAR